MIISLESPIAPPQQDYLPLAYLSSPLAGVSPYLQNQFPEFVREDHPKFITFMKAYYEWLESENNVLNDAKRLKLYQDVDFTRDPYIENFYREFLYSFPRTLQTDLSTLLKNIRDFYRAKGTEKSFELFFRALYGLNPEFYYPRVDILRVSDGKWIQQTNLRVFSSIGDPQSLRARKIRGVTSNYTAYVEKVFSINEGGYFGYELSLNRSSITGNFLPEETLVSEDGLTQVVVSAVPSKITIKQPGQNYFVGEIFDINVIGSGAKLQVQSVSSNGEITSLTILNYGIGYKSYFPLINHLLSDKGAVIDLEYDAVINYPGYYLNEDGQVSTLKYLQDGEYYQAFSYVVYVDESFSTYEANLKKILHPAGLKVYGGFRTQKLLDSKIAIANENSATGITITSSGIAVSASVKSVSNIINRTTVVTANALGPNSTSVNLNKFNYKPVSAYNANTELPDNSNYFGQYGNLATQKSLTPISAFDELGIKLVDLIDDPLRKTNIMPDAVIIDQ